MHWLYCFFRKECRRHFTSPTCLNGPFARNFDIKKYNSANEMEYNKKLSKIGGNFVEKCTENVPYDRKFISQ